MLFLLLWPVCPSSSAPWFSVTAAAISFQQPCMCVLHAKSSSCSVLESHQALGVPEFVHFVAVSAFCPAWYFFFYLMYALNVLHSCVQTFQKPSHKQPALLSAIKKSKNSGVFFCAERWVGGLDLHNELVFSTYINDSWLFCRDTVCCVNKVHSLILKDWSHKESWESKHWRTD